MGCGSLEPGIPIANLIHLNGALFPLRRARAVFVLELRAVTPPCPTLGRGNVCSTSTNLAPSPVQPRPSREQISPCHARTGCKWFPSSSPHSRRDSPSARQTLDFGIPAGPYQPSSAHWHPFCSESTSAVAISGVPLLANNTAERSPAAQVTGGSGTLQHGASCASNISNCQGVRDE